MIYTITFPIRNSIYCPESLRVDASGFSFLIAAKNNRMISVSASAHGIDPSLAPSLTTSDDTSSNETPHSISFSQQLGSLRASAKKLIRSWQSILAPISHIYIDFRAPQETFRAEKDEAIDLHELSSSPAEIVGGTSNHTIYSHAFLCADSSTDTIEPTAFYLEGISAYEEERFVSSYNSFYLVIESIIADGKFNTKDVLRKLEKSDEFMTSLEATCRSEEKRTKDRTLFRGVALSPTRDLIQEIIELRGFLRHHSSKNPRKWSPDDQSIFKGEASFMWAICHRILFSRFTRKLFSNETQEKLQNQLIERGEYMNILVEVTIMDNGLPRILHLIIPQPSRAMTSHFALSSLSQAMNHIEERWAGSDVLSIRGVGEKNGIEYFRYALSNTVQVEHR